jgi:DNA-nicking Smr family endonuclease
MREPHTGKPRGKALTRADLEIWVAVTKDVAAYRQRPVAPAPPPAPAAETRAQNALGARKDAQSAHRPAPVPQSIDPDTRRKLKRGRLDVDARLDLHGMRQAEAHSALNGFLRRAQAEGARIAIVVTGKGETKDGGGVLRRMTPHWLQAPGLQDVVGGFGEASRHHGGEGALYVRLRRLDRGSGARRG